jgi:uncharacterized protein
MTLFTTIIAVIGIIYITIAGSIYLYQRQLLYHPHTALEMPDYYGLPNFQHMTLTTRDNVHITAWYKPAATAEEPVLVYFHGNAGHLGDRYEKLAAFAGTMGVMAVSYRGYGGSHGLPSEQGLYEDGRAAIHYLLTAHKPRNIILYGESLGSGVAVQMATEFNVGALILEAPYTSVRARASELYPYLPVSFLLKDHFDSLSKISTITAPLLILHGEKDTTIPVTHGKALFAAANQPKEAVFFPDTSHSDFKLDDITRHMAKFIRLYIKE